MNSHRGRIQIALLDRAGHLVGAPRVVGSGTDNRLPRVVYDGLIFAVGWEAYPRGGAFVAAVDRDGRVSPVLRLDHGERRAGSVGLAPSEDGFFASFTTNYEGTAVLRALRCRDTAPLGAPLRID